MLPQQLRWVPAVPFARAHEPFTLARATAGHQNQRHGDICCGIGDGTRCVGHSDTGSARGRNVDVVIAHPKIGQDPGARICDIGKDFGGIEIAQRWQNRVEIGQGHAQFIWAHRAGVCAKRDVEILRRGLDNGVRQRAGNQQFFQ